MSELKHVLMVRDEMSEVEADETIRDLKKLVQEGEDPEELLFELGLEPDYIFDILY